ncbi:ribosomal RNA small subunit methyltransferase A [candidate division KSB1 bacterium]|nr:ribosomal RNA small subunit methyltransferase A [candidate division KSB1 bacterium]
MKPKKSLGQNFLCDENIVRKIVHVISPEEQDQILEIGPGYGVLTKYLIEKVAQYVAVELDHALSERLQKDYSDNPRVRIIEDDILEIDWIQLFGLNDRWKVVGNIPYHLTSEIIFKAISYRNHISELILMVQKEVAHRITAEPNSRDYGILAIMSQLYSDVKIQFPVSRNVFYPKPKVDSAVVAWKFFSGPRYELFDEEFFRKLVRALFNQRRKIIRNSLKLINEHLNVDDPVANKRPEQLSIQELVTLSNRIAYGTERY